MKALVAEADEWGGVDVMFNNAGIMHDDVRQIHLELRKRESLSRPWLTLLKDGDAISTSEDVWDLTHKINVCYTPL